MSSLLHYDHIHADMKPTSKGIRKPATVLKNMDPNMLQSDYVS